MIIGIGTDIVDISRIEKSLNAKTGEAFLKRVFTSAELELGLSLPKEKQASFFAKRFAAKEAVSKALGTGIGASAFWKDIETIRLDSGAPNIKLNGRAEKTLRKKCKDYRIHISLSDDTFACAFIVIESI